MYDTRYLGVSEQPMPCGVRIYVQTYSGADHRRIRDWLAGAGVPENPVENETPYSEWWYDLSKELWGRFKEWADKEKIAVTEEEWQYWR